MEFIKTISWGEVIVGAGTLFLAIATVAITAWQIKEARRVWEREVDREYKRKLLDELEGWIQRVMRALNKGWHEARKWANGFSEEGYLAQKGELLQELLGLSEAGFYIREKGTKPFEGYGLKEKFQKVTDKYGDCTDMLHDILGPPYKRDGDDELHCEVELLNMLNDLYRYVIGIRGKEKL